MNASTSGVLSRSVSLPSPSRQGLLGRESDDELDKRLGVADFLRELPLRWKAEPLFAVCKSSELLTTPDIDCKSFNGRTKLTFGPKIGDQELLLLNLIC